MRIDQLIGKSSLMGRPSCRIINSSHGFLTIVFGCLSIILVRLMMVAVWGGEAHAGGLNENSQINSTFMKVWVSHIYDAHSPARPPNCDEVCASHLHIQRLNQAWAAREKARNQSHTRKMKSTHPDDYWPAGQVTTGYFHSGAVAEYYVQLSAGSYDNPQPILLFIDTGSHLTWMQCKPCNPCYSQAFPVFNPNKSPTYESQPPGSRYCNILQNTRYGTGVDGGTCNYALSYLDGSGSQGQLAFDNIYFWDWNTNDGSSTVTFGLPFGCGFSNVNPISTVTSGVLGLADELGISWPEYWYNEDQYNPSFTFCFAPVFSQPNSGWIIFLDGATTPTQGIPYYTTTPILDKGIYGMVYMDVIDFVVNGQRVHIPNGVFDIDANDGSGGVILDTGSGISHIIEDAYDPLKDAWQTAVYQILGDPDNNPTPGPSGFQMCWDYPNDVQLPDLGFYFRDQQVFYLSAKAKVMVYYSQSNNRRMCFPFFRKQLDEDAAFHPAMIWASHSLHNHRIIVDKQNELVGWQYNCC